MIVLGHQREKEIFTRALGSGKLHHAYIFSGTTGVGKRRFAVELARGIFCREGKLFQPCECSACVQMEAGVYPDFYLLEDTDLKIDNIREIAEAVNMSPLSGEWKVVIMDNVDKMQIPAANSFLKTLEEPGANTIFFLITDRYERLLPTIRSRCLKLEFGRLTDEQVRDLVLAQEPDAEGLDAVIAVASGSAGIALSMVQTPVDTFVKAVENRDWMGLANAMNSADKPTFVAGVTGLYRFTCERFRQRHDLVGIDYGYYLLDILRRFDYNVVLEIMKMDVLAKTIEVFREKG